MDGEKDKWTVAPIHRGYTQLYKAAKWLHDKWIQTDKQFYDKIYFCGGFLRWACSPLPDPEPASDLDIYCETEEVFNWTRWHLSRQLKRKKNAENPVSVTYLREKDPNQPFFPLPNIQLIKPIDDGSVKTVGTLYEILDNFDFSIVRLGASIEKIMHFQAVTCDGDYHEHEKKKRIVIKNIHCPISSTYRMIKYTRRGYWVNTTEVLKLFVDWENRDESYRRRLMDFFDRINDGEAKEPSEQEILEIERLLRID